MAEARTLAIHIARCDETGRWYVADSDVPGLRLEAEDAPSLIRRIELAAPEMLDLNAAEVETRFGIKPGDAVRLTPVFDTPLQLAA
jgi:hypothetical protein